MKRNVVFEDAAFEDFEFWVKEERKIVVKILELINSCMYHLLLELVSLRL